jgi:hypothetical protein
MAKTTKSPLNEAEIIRRRDGVADTSKPLDAPARRMLADARLRALALALDLDDRGQDGDYPDDTELLAYLLDTLPDQRRQEVELSVRGNARAFGRLVALRTAFNTHLDKRDRSQAEHRAWNVVRRKAQEVEVRKFGEQLLFRDAPTAEAPGMPRARTTSTAGLLQSRQNLVSKNFLAPPEKRRHWQMRPDSKTGSILRNHLQRATLPVASGRHLIEEALSLLAQLEKLNPARRAGKEEPPPANEPRLSELQHVRDRLVDVLFRLQRESDRLADDIRLAVLVAIDTPAPDGVSYYRADLVSEVLANLADPEKGWPGWYPTKLVSAGQWSLLFAGVVVPRPILTATLKAADASGPGDLPTLTLVRPKEGFEIADVDSAGVHKVNLPPGGSVLLVQGEKEIWEIPLMLGES